MRNLTLRSLWGDYTFVKLFCGCPGRVRPLPVAWVDPERQAHLRRRSPGRRLASGAFGALVLDRWVRHNLKRPTSLPGVSE